MLCDHARHAYGRSKRRGLHKDRETEFLFDLAQHLEAIAFPFPAVNGEKRNNRQAGLLEKALLNVLVHSDCRRENACSYIRQTCQVEKTLHGAVFAACAMEDGEDHIDHYARLSA